jgi:hypothetical protein
MKLIISNGTDVSLFVDDAGPINACISPGSPILISLSADPYYTVLDEFVET